MSVREKLYIEKHFKRVAHTTLDPEGPGVVRIHLVPARNPLKEPSVVILNGQDVIPINPSWAILLNNLIREVNHFDGIELSREMIVDIVRFTIDRTRKVYPKTSRDVLKKDIETILTALCDIAYGKEPSVDVEYMSIGEYAPNMTAPHRIDLMISAMTKDGHWNCNQKCLHCYASGQRFSEVPELTTADWKKIISKCQKANISQLTFTGGEPTLRKDLVELVDYSRWFVTRLNTNGLNMSKELCEQLYEASLDSVQITFYSYDEKKHNSLVCTNGFERTVSGIKNALETGLGVSINTPLCAVNSDYIKTLEFLYELGVRYVTCSGLILTGNACEDTSKKTRLSEDELYSILCDATDFCNEHKMEISFTSPGWVSDDKLAELGLSIPSCGACLSNMAIAPDGTVVPCQSWLSNGADLGNMLTDSWKNIWESPVCSRIRKNSAKMIHTCPLKGKETK